MKVTTKKIADLLGGELVGPGDVPIYDLAKIEEAGEGSITFLANPRYTPYVYKTGASAIVVSKQFVPEKPVKAVLIKVDDPYSAFTDLLEWYNGHSHHRSGIEQPSFIHPSARIGKHVYVGAFSYIDEQAEIGNNVKIYPQVYVGPNVKIGDNTVLYPGVRVYHDCRIGANCIIHSGAVIGSDGFGFAPNGTDYKKIPQIGNVIIEDNVEIGANTTIDRATLGSTVIRSGVKLDNQIQVGHNVEIGENTVIAAQSGISGSSKIGRNCQFGGQSGVAGHLRIGNNVKVGAKTGITRNVKDNEVLIGAPAVPADQFRKMFILFKKLPELYQDIKDLKSILKK
ncbi:MAG: UDP-3-O-(3-hydroxymyristoyl)glucosamine N-acyltransferase [Chlorobi bacterium]|nr:UDP-3-O-(3-hydroxymyristoyl)glucosamine N-acyltransferase [Chlorobiota bacterium]